MSDSVRIKKLNEVHVQVIAEPGIMYGMSDYFTFDVPGASFTPKFREGLWDGKIRLLNINSGIIYGGLIQYVQKFCINNDYKFELDPELFPKAIIDDKDVLRLAAALKTPFVPRDYQTTAVSHCINKNRVLLLSPTGSGKSFIIYLLAKYNSIKKRRSLIIVPTTSLVLQMKNDFENYNNGNPVSVHIIMAGKEKNSDCDITVSTWQSIYKLPKKWFEQFNVIFGDEAHNFKANSLKAIMEKTGHIKYRYGLTGTIDGTKTHKLVLEGLFGPLFETIKTKTLIEKKTLADLAIKSIILQYGKESIKTVKGMTYQEEIAWLVSNKARNKYIVNLASSLTGNTLVLYQFVDTHGKVLLPLMEAKNKNVHFVHGGVSAQNREEIRHHIENSKETNILLASYGTFSTGIDITNLNNVIFASPYKSRIKNLQSIGRVLRRSETKQKAVLYDIADNLIALNRNKKRVVNFSSEHFAERTKIYHQEGFDLKIFNIKLNEIK